MFARVLTSGCLLCLTLLVHPVAAQTVYKSIMPDGSVVFSDEPMADAVKVETSRPNTSDTGVQILPPGANAEDDRQRRRAEREEDRESREEREDPQEARRKAEQALREAEQALANGKEPLPGERTGNVGGTSRLNEKYWERQRSLEEAVAEARERLNNL